MSVSGIRGGTPVEHELPSYYINDSELSAQLNRITEQSRVQQARQLEERAPTMFKYYGLQGHDVRTPDREESPSLGIGTPTENGVAPYDLNDPELSAQLHLLTELSRVQEARRIEEFDRQMAAGYRPPAEDIHTQDREESPPGGVTRPFRHEDAPHRIKDPQLLARLNELSDYFQAQEARRLEEYGRQMLADYQPPPDIRTPDREPSPPVGGLPSPASSPLLAQPQPPATHVRPLSTNSLPASQPTASSIKAPKPTTNISISRPRRTLQRSVITTRSKAAPHTVFLELDSFPRSAQKNTFKPATSRKPDALVQGASRFANRSIPLSTISKYAGVRKRKKTGRKEHRNG